MDTLTLLAAALTMLAVAVAAAVLARRGRDPRRTARTMLAGGAALGGVALVLLALGG